MANETIQNARNTYEKICEVLTDNQVKFKRNDDLMLVDNIYTKGDSFVLPSKIIVNPNLEIFTTATYIPFRIPKEAFPKTAMLLNYLNDRLLLGGFDFDLAEGTIKLKTTGCFKDLDLSKAVIGETIFLSILPTHTYADKILAFSKSDLSVDEFIKTNFNK